MKTHLKTLCLLSWEIFVKHIQYITSLKNFKPIKRMGYIMSSKDCQFSNTYQEHHVQKNWAYNIPYFEQLKIFILTKLYVFQTFLIFLKYITILNVLHNQNFLSQWPACHVTWHGPIGDLVLYCAGQIGCSTAKVEKSDMQINTSVEYVF